MNGSAIDFDYLDGNFLACNGDKDYVILCDMLRYGLGTLLCVSGLLQAVVLLRKVFCRRNRDTNTVIMIKAREGSHQLRDGNCDSETRQRQDKSAAAARAFKLDLNIGIASMSIFYGLALSIGVCGTEYPAGHPIGQLCDFVFVLFIASAVRVSLLQCKGATWFDSTARGVAVGFRRKGSIEHPWHIMNVVLDTVQGPLLFPSSFGLWGLQVTGVLTKSTFYTICFIFRLTAACRAVHAMLKKRASVLAKVAIVQFKRNVQADATGSRRNSSNKSSVLKTKTRNLMFDLSTVVITVILADLSILLSRGNKSSGRLVICLAVFGFIGIINSGLISAQTRFFREQKRVHPLITGHGITSQTNMEESTIDPLSRIDSSVYVHEHRSKHVDHKFNGEGLDDVAQS